MQTINDSICGFTFIAFYELNKRTSILPTIVSRKSVPFEGDLLGEEAHR